MIMILLMGLWLASVNGLTVTPGMWVVAWILLVIRIFAAINDALKEK